MCSVCLWPQPVPLYPLQSDRHHNVLWSCRASVSGDVSVCRLWWKHHIYQSAAFSASHMLLSDPTTVPGTSPNSGLEAGPLRFPFASTCSLLQTAVVTIPQCSLQYQRNQHQDQKQIYMEMRNYDFSCRYFKMLDIIYPYLTITYHAVYLKVRDCVLRPSLNCLILLR